MRWPPHTCTCNSAKANKQTDNSAAPASTCLLHFYMRVYPHRNRSAVTWQCSQRSRTAVGRGGSAFLIFMRVDPLMSAYGEISAVVSSVPGMSNCAIVDAQTCNMHNCTCHTWAGRGMLGTSFVLRSAHGAAMVPAKVGDDAPRVKDMTTNKSISAIGARHQAYRTCGFLLHFIWDAGHIDAGRGKTSHRSGKHTG